MLDDPPQSRASPLPKDITSFTDIEHHPCKEYATSVEQQKQSL
jgi:hypothetical protein